MRVREMTMAAMLAAMLCVCGPLTIPIGPIPVSLANFMIYLIGATVGPRLGIVSVLLYLLIGMAGLPVFSGFSGGLPKLLGPTGGFLMGDLPCVFLVGLGTGDAAGREAPAVRRILFLLAGAAVLYIMGTLWYMFLTKNSLWTSVSLCVLPFLPLDVLKMAAAYTISGFLRIKIRPWLTGSGAVTN